MKDENRIVLLLLAMMAVAVVIAGSAIGILYETALDLERQRLVESARSQARLMEAVARHDQGHFHENPRQWIIDSIEQIRAAHGGYAGFGKTGEFVLARNKGDGASIVMIHRLSNVTGSSTDSTDTTMASEAMRLALGGQSGSLIGLDYRGVEVLAAYEPVALLDLGVVAKIDMAEIRQRFIEAGKIVAAIALAAAALGSIFLFLVNKATVRRMRESERRFRELFENMSSGVAVYEAVDGGQDFRFKDLNRGGERIEGVQRGDVIGRLVTEAFPGVRDLGLLDVLRRVWRSGESEHLPVSFYKDDNTQSWRENFVYKLPGGEVVAVYDDVTALNEAETNLRQAHKMEALGKLTGGIAHDFNNILAVIMGNLEFLEEQIANQERPSRLARRACEAAKRGAQLTERLLSFSRKQHLRPTVLNISSVVSGMVEMLRRTLDASVSVRTLVPGNLWQVMADRGQLESAILNLAVNAHKAMPDGGTFRIEMQNVVIGTEGPSGQMGIAPGRYVVIAVSDTGVGMSRDVMEHAFEPFFTTREPGAGSGLGLSMVYGFAKQSGGTATIDSHTGVGTTVKLYLPASAEDAEEDTAYQETDQDAESGGNETILVVEDEEEVRELVATRLRDMGYRVFEAEDGTAAMETLDNQPEIDLLFTDIVMPGAMTGTDLARRAVERLPDLKVLFTSGYPDARLDDGPATEVSLLRKPYSSGDMAKAVRAVLES